MNYSWCRKCHTDVSPSFAYSGLPCKNCGGSEFTIIETCMPPGIEGTDQQADWLMRQGFWKEAAETYRSNNDYEQSEITLRMATLQLREECTKHVDSFLSKHPSGIAISSFRQELLDNYDEFVTAWILQDYQGISLIPNGCSYYVKRRDFI